MTRSPPSRKISELFKDFAISRASPVSSSYPLNVLLPRRVEMTRPAMASTATTRSAIAIGCGMGFGNGRNAAFLRTFLEQFSRSRGANDTPRFLGKQRSFRGSGVHLNHGCHPAVGLLL